MGTFARLGDKLRSLLRADSVLFRSGETAEELILARHGPVEIRQTLAGWSLETCVTGAPERARVIALRRLGRYVNGENRGKAQLRVMRPLVQAEEAAGRWRLRVALPGVERAFVAAAGRNGEVRLRALDSETLAVIRVLGRPTPLAVRHAETAIRCAITPTRWTPTGNAMLRLHAPPVVPPFLGRFEVAVPVVEQTHGSSATDWMNRVTFDRPAARKVATSASPLLR